MLDCDIINEGSLLPELLSKDKQITHRVQNFDMCKVSVYVLEFLH